MANLTRNDSDQVVASADQASNSNDEFRNLAQQFSELVSSGTGLEGSAQMALAEAGQRVLESATRFYNTAQPRIDSVRESASASLNVGEEGANALNSVDVGI